MANLWLSAQGIWYFRKVTTLSNGKRKELKKSLRTRDKAIAKQKVHALLACVVSERTKPAPEPEIESIDYHKELKVYLKLKSVDVAEREVLSIERFIVRYLTFTNAPNSKQQAVKFLDSLTVSDGTKNKHASKIGAFFYWLNKRYDAEIKNPFEGLKIRTNESAKDKRAAYTEAQIRFLSSSLSQMDTHKQWIIKVGMFTGMRCNEIVQLSAGDVLQVDGIWCISINDTHDYQRLKNKASKRIIPLHNELHAFVLYAKARADNERIFPEFKAYKGNCAHYFGKWFTRWRANNNLPEFHSIRHYVATKLKSEGVPVQYTAALLGHSNNSITYDRYGKDIAPDKLLELVELL